MKKIFLVFACCIVTIAHAQTVMLSEDVPATFEKKFGPNEKKYVMAYFNYGLICESGTAGAKVNSGFGSYDFQFGIRVKRKIGNVYSLGYEFLWQSYSFALAQDSGKILPDNVLHKDEAFNFRAFGIAFYNRFNFDPNRGEYIGKFLDIGAQANVNIRTEHVTNDKLPNGDKVETITTNLGYINPFNYFLFVRLGIGHLSVFANYRLSKQFKKTDEFDFPELPRVFAGLEIAFF